MEFSKIDFTHDCFVDLHVEGYGAVSGMFFENKEALSIFEGLFKDAHDWQKSFERNGINYMMGFVDAGNLQFNEFMQDEISKEKAGEFYKSNGFYEQTHDFLDVWVDNDISDVQISFPLISHDEGKDNECCREKFK